jgi:hypothetical protein
VQGPPQLIVKTFGGSPVIHTSIRSTEFSRNPLESKRLDRPIYTACSRRLLLDARLESFCSASRSQINAAWHSFYVPRIDSGVASDDLKTSPNRLFRCRQAMRT